MAEELATQRRCIDRINQNWSRFLERRRERLAQQERYGAASEKVAENILEDLFTEVLDWEVADLNNQVGYADLVVHIMSLPHPETLTAIYPLPRLVAETLKRTAASEVWLDPSARGVQRLKLLLHPYRSEEMEASPVSPRVNNPVHDTPERIARLA